MLFIASSMVSVNPLRRKGGGATEPAESGGSGGANTLYTAVGDSANVFRSARPTNMARKVSK